MHGHVRFKDSLQINVGSDSVSSSPRGGSIRTTLSGMGSNATPTGRKKKSIETLSGVLPPGVQPQELSTVAERDKNRAMLRELYEKVHSREMDYANMQKAAEESFERMAREQERIFEERIARLEMVSSRSIEELRKQNELLMRQNEQLKEDVRKEQLDILDLQRMVTDPLTLPEDAVHRLDEDNRQITIQLNDLRGQLLSRGIIVPVRVIQPESPEVEQQRPPVGTIELGEDVFTARLLLRLGFMKAAHADDVSSVRSLVLSEDEESSEYSVSAFENVTGIVDPEVEAGSAGYFKVTTGWSAVCGFTVLTQLMALGVMMLNGIALAEGDCYDHIPTPKEWWLLHTSKGAAMLVAATLMSRQLMDIVNYTMVAEFMFHRRSWEVIITAVLRVVLSFVIIASNIVVFMRLTNPADVWMNMTAFAFISSLAGDILDVAKRGVFGHDIQRTVTALNFTLHFMDRYPSWFHYVKVVALSISATTILVFSFVTFTMGDQMCS